MNVQLYVYDLSGGIARNMSAVLLGIQVDAIYHTSIVMGGIEYTYDGGIKTVSPGATHLGQPMQTIELGVTDLPMDVIMEYLESLKHIYTAAAYDIWKHNCNNFTNDFSTFLVGTGIPQHITNLPQTVLNTPFGRMIRPQIEQMVQANRQQKGSLLGIDNAVEAPKTQHQLAGSVRKAKSMRELNRLLEEAEKSCAVVFFTSPTCRPCAALYPVFDELAAETAQKATLILVDISTAHELGSKYDIRATPTFLTFIRGKKENRWSGSDPSTLRGNLKLLLQMTWPPHPHESLVLPALRGANTKPVLYSKIPPLNKLKVKLGSVAEDPALMGVMNFVAARDAAGAAEATLPDLDHFSQFLREAPSKLPAEIVFIVVDLLRVALTDARFSGYYAEEKEHATIAPLLSYVNSLKVCPYPLRLVTLQMACNLFSSQLYLQYILGSPKLTQPIVQLVTTSLLDDKHHNVRVAAASLCFNIAAANSAYRTEEHRDPLPEEDQIELAASLLQAIEVEEDSAEALKGFLLAFGYLVFCTPKDRELENLLKTMDAQDTVLGKKKKFPQELLVDEIGEELLTT